LLIIVGAAELFVALACLLPQQEKLANEAVIWMAGNFVMYRVGMAFLGWSHCYCLGNLTDALHVSAAIADRIMRLLLAYLLLGSCAVFWLQRSQCRMRRAVSACRER
jgi:hypothetical protein